MMAPAGCSPSSTTRRTSGVSLRSAAPAHPTAPQPPSATLHTPTLQPMSGSHSASAAHSLSASPSQSPSNSHYQSLSQSQQLLLRSRSPSLSPSLSLSSSLSRSPSPSPLAVDVSVPVTTRPLRVPPPVHPALLAPGDWLDDTYTCEKALVAVVDLVAENLDILCRPPPLADLLAAAEPPSAAPGTAQSATVTRDQETQLMRAAALEDNSAQVMAHLEDVSFTLRKLFRKFTAEGIDLRIPPYSLGVEKEERVLQRSHELIRLLDRRFEKLAKVLAAPAAAPHSYDELDIAAMDLDF